jgi:hypothetical protein
MSLTNNKIPLAIVAVFSLCLGTQSLMAFPVCGSEIKKKCFTGKFQLSEILAEKKNRTLDSDFGYIDSNGVGWEAKQGSATDGASIPKLFQPFIGTPWEESYIRAAVIHDWYCDHNVYPWRETHKVFYEIMIESGVPVRKAKLMFYAVYAFGPKWGYTSPGSTCSVTKNCIQTKDSVFVKIGDKYSDENNIPELKAMEASIDIAESKGGYDLDQLAEIAEKAHPTQDLYESAIKGGALTK